MGLTQNTWLLESVVGALIGLALPYLVQIVMYIIKRRHRTSLCGAWFSYSFIIENKIPKIYNGTFTIKRGLTQLYTVKVQENGLIYKGCITIENNHMLFMLKTTDGIRNETSCIRFDRSPHTKHSSMSGYWLSYDSDNFLSCGVMLLSKVELSKNTVEEIAVSTSKSYYNNCIMRIEY